MLVRRRAAQGVRRGARAVRLRRRRRFRRARRRRRGGRRRRSTSATCSAARAGGGGLGDVLGGIFDQRGGGRDAAPPGAAPTSSPRSRCLRRGGRRRHRPAAADQRAALPDLPRHRRQAAARCRACARPASGTGQISRNQGGFAFAEPCRDCQGRGLVVDDPCPDCHGSGRGDRHPHASTSASRPGVKDGQRIRLQGKGAPGERGGPAGDLYVVVHVDAAPGVRPQGRQPDRDRAGHLRRGRARRRDQGADARRRRR